MIIESNFAIAIARHTDWLKDLALVFQPMRKKKTIAPWTRDFHYVLSKLRVTARNSDWFIALFAPVVVNNLKETLAFRFKQKSIP